ncbi:hypothetical protein [Chitinophaga sancti]
MKLSDQLLPMVLWTAALFLVFYLFRHYNQSRSPRVNVRIGIVFSLAAWLTNWVWYRNMEMKGIHLVELVMVSLPIFIMPMMRYYCEKCREHYAKTSVYVLDASKYYQLANHSDNFSFLLELDLKYLPETGPKETKEIIKVDFYCCESCGSNSIIDIDSYTWSRTSEHKWYIRESIHKHNTHNRSVTSRQKGLVQGAYLDADTGSKLKQYLVG